MTVQGATTLITGMAAHGLRFIQRTVKTLKRRLMEAISAHTDDMYLSREWSRSNGFVSLPCCGREVSSSFSSLVCEICRRVMYDQPAEH